MNRFLGIDYGKVRIGLACSDPTKTIALPLKTVQAGNTIEETAATLISEISSLSVEKIVMGLPLLLSGKESETTQEVRELALLLEGKSGLPIVLWDERLTSKQVERMLIAAKVKRKKRTKEIDPLSAALILQSYLDQPKSQ